MSKFVKFFIVFLLILAAFFMFLLFRNNGKIDGIFKNNVLTGFEDEEVIDKNSIKYTGWLKTEGAVLENEKGEPIQLRGLSSHGIQWFPQVLTYDNLKQLKDEWKINVFRYAMYTDSSANGYIAHPEESKQELYRLVDLAKELDMYVIIDWHILSDYNPQQYQTQAHDFFDEVSERYKDTPNVIYEICNEPNGNANWNDNIKPYADDIIGVIRKNCPKSLIIVGTPMWCTYINEASESPLNYKNIVYACHFYAGSHGVNLRKDIESCIQNNIPIFVSECGITDATGNGEIYKNSFKEWIDFLNEKNISWIFWSFSNKDESSSILQPNFPVRSNDSETKNNIENEKNNDLNMINENAENNENKLEESKSNDVNANSNKDVNGDSEIKSDVVNIDDYLTETGKYLKEIFLII